MKEQKASKKDFTVENLPHNRVEVFFDVIKQRYDVLLKIGVLLLVFLLPFLMVKLIEQAAYINLISADNASENDIISLQLSVSIVNVGPIVFFGFGLSGVMKIIRNLVWYEPIFFFKDFRSGQRQNKLIYIFVFLIYGLISVLIKYLNGIIENNFLKTIPVGLCLALLLPIGMYILSATVVYKDGFVSLLKSAVVFFIKTVPISFLFVLVLSGAFCVELIDHIIIRYVLIVFVILICLPMYLLAWTLYSHKIFDKMVNYKIYPGYVDKGINRNV